MERRKFTREFKLEAVRLIKERGVFLCAGFAGLGRACVAVARLGEEVRRRSGTGLSWPRPDEAGAARDRASQALRKVDGSACSLGVGNADEAVPQSLGLRCIARF